MLHINILLSEYFLVQGSRSCNTEQNGSSLPQNGSRNLPDRAPAQEVWAVQEAVSKREPALPKALPAPNSQTCTHSGPLQDTQLHPQNTGERQAQVLPGGSLLPAGHPPARRSTGTLPPQEPPLEVATGPKPHRALAQPENNPAPKACAARRLQSSTEHSTLVHLKHLIFTPSN